MSEAALAEVTLDESGSTYKVPFTKILKITAHGNADKLEIAWVYGFQVIVQRDRYKAGDKIIYIPIDSILPETLESKLFPPDSKIKLHNHRVRQIKIRQIASQGMIVDPQDVAHVINPEFFKDEQDLKDILGIKKYEPPQPGFSQTIGKDKQRNKKDDHPLFHKYNGIDNIKWFPDLFQETEEVIIQEKLHGTNARASILPYIANTWWKKLKKFLGLAPKWENCYGSNNVDISARTTYTGFYGEDVYGAMFKKINVFKKLKPGETVFGEIIGPSIQKNYEYGLKEHKFVLFDVKILEKGTCSHCGAPKWNQRWLNPEEAEAFAIERGFEFVPVLYRGPFNKEFTYTLTSGNSEYCKEQKVKEGIVIKSRSFYNTDRDNKKALKWISEAYLDDKSNTDFH